jgi:A/G-specific adenine glycosylase
MNYDYSNTIDYLLDWYDLNARILAWRENPKPYYVWVSEIMLQQTRVEAVKFYFDRFINTLPDINALADVEEEKLLKLWEGLGYYNRVRNLQKAAKIIVEKYNGQMPADYNALLALPGIGSYTAGAIASIAFKIPQPAVDGNVLRVMKRVAGSFDDITKEKVKKEL